MLYKKSSDKFDRGQFKSPGSEYRGAPFWAWNGELDQKELDWQIGVFKRMGLGGFHMHVRTGLSEPYLGEDFMRHIEGCVETARSLDMLAWLYDEDRWPSGSAGGRVTKERPEFARKTLLLTTRPYDPSNTSERPSEPGRGQASMRQENGILLAVYDIRLDEGGNLISYGRIAPEDPVMGVKWYAYMEHATADPWFNDSAYLDTLDPQAVEAFIESTHEVYKARLKEDLGGTAPGIFTDEPQFAPRRALSGPWEQEDLILPWTPELPEEYESHYSEDLLDVLPQLIWELPGGRLSGVRWRFQNLVTDMFRDSYCKKIGDWCRENGLLLTGHLMGEPTLESQTQAVGDAMRCYPEFGLPGIDMLCDGREFTTAKQAQSIARQQGAPGVLSELYGVTGWDYDFRGYKLQGDWQAALGVTLRVPHLSWLTMKGEAKRDYPASISYQSPWWEEFHMVEDHFARLNTVLTRGRADVRVAVLHPIESYWMLYGPASQTAGTRGEMEDQFVSLCGTLLLGTIDFDYLNEELLPGQYMQRPYTGPNSTLQIGEGRYQVVLVPPVKTIRSGTIQVLSEFQSAGGRVIFLGGCPEYIDGEPIDGHEEGTCCQELYEAAEHIAFSREAVLAALEPQRDLDIRCPDGSRKDGLLYQLREDGECKWLFICNAQNPESPDVDPAPRLKFTITGEYGLELFDTLTGETGPVPCRYQGGNTVMERVWHSHDSILLRLNPGRTQERQAAGEACGDIAGSQHDVILHPVDIRLSEPNMLLLDMAEYSLNKGEWNSLEEILRIDNIVRERLGIPPRRKEVVQPYLLKEEDCPDRLSLRFRLRSEVKLSGLRLGIEEPRSAKISLNGLNVPIRPEGWYVDKAIETIPLPELFAGESVLEITVPVGRRTNLEAFYLLGDFGVWTAGANKTLTEPVRRLSFGDITCQGLAFYTGNVEYGFRVLSEGDFTVRVPSYRGGLIKVLVDGQDMGNIAFSPYSLKIPAKAGEHLVVLRLYGTRQNGFAQLHHISGVSFYQSPNSWRSSGDLWSYEYQLKAAGILKSPEIYGARIIRPDGSFRTGGREREIKEMS